MTQDSTNFEVTDAELEQASGGAGQWMQGKSGGWMWHSQDVTGSASPHSANVSTNGGSSSVRMELIDGKQHYFKFDGKAERLHAVR
jgi:hypothetical protein